MKESNSKNSNKQWGKRENNVGKKKPMKRKGVIGRKKLDDHKETNEKKVWNMMPFGDHNAWEEQRENYRYENNTKKIKPISRKEWEESFDEERFCCDEET